jgi:hypothetical protein
LAPLGVQAATSVSTARIKAQGFFITDIDSQQGRRYEQFSAIKANKEYDLWINKNSCTIEH